MYIELELLLHGIEIFFIFGGLLWVVLLLRSANKKADQLKDRMGDVSLRLTITETRLEERHGSSLLVDHEAPKRRGRPPLSK